MAELMKADGTSEFIEPKNGTDFKLQELYDILNCSTIQTVYLADGKLMILDEDGKYKPHHHNDLASILLAEAGGLSGDYIAGDALVCNRGDML